jgi:hypothetical protein
MQNGKWKIQISPASLEKHSSFTEQRSLAINASDTAELNHFTGKSARDD